jgi:hypothetical protein
VPELDYLLEMGFLTPDARNLLDEFRALGPGAGGAASEDLQEAVAVRVVGAMRGFSEFSALVATARQLSVSKGRLSDAAKHLDLLGDLNRPRLSSGIAGDDDSASAAEVLVVVNLHTSSEMHLMSSLSFRLLVLWAVCLRPFSRGGPRARPPSTSSTTERSQRWMVPICPVCSSAWNPLWSK